MRDSRDQVQKERVREREREKEKDGYIVFKVLIIDFLW